MGETAVGALYYLWREIHSSQMGAALSDQVTRGISWAMAISEYSDTRLQYRATGYTTEIETTKTHRGSIGARLAAGD